MHGRRLWSAVSEALAVAGMRAFLSPGYHESSAKAGRVWDASRLAARAPENHRPEVGLLQLRPLQITRAATGGAFVIIKWQLAMVRKGLKKRPQVLKKLLMPGAPGER